MTEINDSHLLMYLDGVLEPELQAIIEKNEQHKARVALLKQMQIHLTGRFYRVNCVDSLVLGEYYLEMVSKSQQKIIKKHLQECPHCTRELAEIELFLRPSLVERIIATLVSGGGDTREHLVPAFQVRGGEEGFLVYQAEEAQIVVDLQEDGAHPGYQAIIGLITGIEASNFEVILWQDKDERARSRIDELGNFVIDHLEPGEYELEIKGPKIEIQIQKFLIP